MAPNDNSCIDRWQEATHLPTPAPDNEDPQAPTQTHRTYSARTQTRHPELTSHQHPRKQLGVNKAEKCSGLIKITKQTTLQWRPTLAQINCWHLSDRRAGIDCAQEVKRPAAHSCLGTFSQLTLTCNSYSHCVSIWCGWTTHRVVFVTFFYLYVCKLRGGKKTQH